MSDKQVGLEQGWPINFPQGPYENLGLLDQYVEPNIQQVWLPTEEQAEK